MCIVAGDRGFTGDTLLIGGTGRTDLPTGDPEALYDSLFNVVLKLDPDLSVYPAHHYKGRSSSTIGDEIGSNPRLAARERGATVRNFCFELGVCERRARLRLQSSGAGLSLGRPGLR